MPRSAKSRPEFETVHKLTVAAWQVFSMIVEFVLVIDGLLSSRIGNKYREHFTTSCVFTLPKSSSANALPVYLSALPVALPVFWCNLQIL